MSPPRSRPWREAHPHEPGPDHTCPLSRSRPPPSFLAETLARTSRHRSPPGLLRRTRSRHTSLWLIDPRRAHLPRQQQETQTSHVPLHLHLPALRPHFSGLLPTQTQPGQTTLGQAALTPPHHHITTFAPARSTVTTWGLGRDGTAVDQGLHRRAGRCPKDDSPTRPSPTHGQIRTAHPVLRMNCPFLLADRHSFVGLTRHRATRWPDRVGDHAPTTWLYEH